MRKVLRSGATELSYKRELQPQRKLGFWVETPTAILESEEKLPRRERRSTIRLFEELRGRGYDGAQIASIARERRRRRSFRCGSIPARPISSTGAMKALSFIAFP